MESLCNSTFMVALGLSGMQLKSQMCNSSLNDDHSHKWRKESPIAMGTDSDRHTYAQWHLCWAQLLQIQGTQVTSKKCSK